MMKSLSYTSWNVRFNLASWLPHLLLKLMFLIHGICKVRLLYLLKEVCWRGLQIMYNRHFQDEKTIDMEALTVNVWLIWLVWSWFWLAKIFAKSTSKKLHAIIVFNFWKPLFSWIYLFYQYNEYKYSIYSTFWLS